MAKNPETVEKFLDDMNIRVAKQAQNELKKLQDFKRNLTGDQSTIFKSWDYQYFIDKYNKRLFNLDENKLAEYFPSEHVL